MNSMPLPYTRILTWCDRRPLCAEAIARRLLAATPAASPDYPWALFTLGWCLMIREKLEEAFVTLERAQAALERASLELGVLRARHGLLLVGLLRGLSSDALPAWEELATAYDQRSMPLQAARVRIGQIRCLNILWRPTEALSMLAPIQATIDELGNDQDRALLSQRNPTRFAALPDNPNFIHRRDNRDFSRNPDDLRIPKRLPNGIYVETNHSANSIVRRIGQPLDVFNIERSEFAIYLREDRDAKLGGIGMR